MNNSKLSFGSRVVSRIFLRWPWKVYDFIEFYSFLPEFSPFNFLAVVVLGGLGALTGLVIGGGDWFLRGAILGLVVVVAYVIWLDAGLRFGQLLQYIANREPSTRRTHWADKMLSEAEFGISRRR